MNNVSEGLITTNDNCVGCNRCIGVCSCPGATIASESAGGENIIRVDGSRCIACGACIDACEHHAREYSDDSAKLVLDLKSGEKISVLVAPSFFAVYGDEAGNILGRLKTLGVNKVYSVAYGADITTWAYLNHIAKNNLKGCISQPCPAVVDYIEKYIPELIPKLMPVQSPLMCMAVYLKKYRGVSDRLAFIGPCIAKKNEIISGRGMGLVSYSATYDHLMKLLRKENIAPSPYKTEDCPGLGSVYPMAGGLKENIQWFLGTGAYVRQVEGEKRLYKYLDTNKDRILGKNSPYTLIDALNCTDGCLCGTGVEDVNTSREDTLVRIAQINEERKAGGRTSAWAAELSPAERLANLNEQFSELDIRDFYCTYEDKSKKCLWKVPSDEDIDRVFDEMDKKTPAERSINCSGCGYDNCRQMAAAIYNGFNHKENCIHFIKNVLEGINSDYTAVMLISEETRAVHLVKYTGGKATRRWIENRDYDYVIRNYAGFYVDEKDRERVLAETEFSALEKKLGESGHFATTFVRRSETGKSEYYLMDFAETKGRKDIILSFRNIDEAVRREMEHKKELEEALAAAEQASTAKSTFLANMSHEIRTPINAILGMDTMILRESSQENVLEYAENVKTAGNTLLTLIDDILNFSKLGSGKMGDASGIAQIFDDGSGQQASAVLNEESLSAESTAEKTPAGSADESTGSGQQTSAGMKEEKPSTAGSADESTGSGQQTSAGLNEERPSAAGSAAEKPCTPFRAPDADILVVDDVDMNITVFCSLLKRTRIKPDCCHSGMEALEAAQAKKYDIIFLDSMMPGLSGTETLHEIRRTCPLNADTPAVVITANAVVGAREQYLEEGFTEFLSKPLEAENLERVIRRFLPENRITEISGDGTGDEEDALSKENAERLAALDEIPGISTADGIKAAGGAETYLSICGNFLDTSSKRIGMIRDLFEQKDMENYTIQVHALKSSARLIGAGGLSAQALEMETAGRRKDTDAISAKTGPLLENYEGIIKAMDAAFRQTEGEDDRPELTLKKLNRRLSDLLELMEAFDFESGRELFAELGSYRLPSEGERIYAALKAGMADVDRDDIISLLKDYLGA